MKDAIGIKNLRVEHSSETLLGPLSLTIAEGSFVAIIGPNGSGKTTLLKTVLDLAGAYDGQVWVNGADAKGLSPQQRAANVAWLPQKDFAAEPIDVLEFVMTARFRFQEMRTESIEAARAALNDLNIAHLQSRSIATLSGGELQKVASACLLAQAAPILLVDEPGNHLDPGQQLQTYKLLGEQWRSGKTVVCVTHNINRLRELGSPEELANVRVIGLNTGSIAFDTGFHDAALANHLSKLFGATFTPLPFEDRPHFAVTPQREH